MEGRKNRGFTLVELLAVIVVLAIIMIIAVPTVLRSMDNAKKSALLVEARKIVNTASIKRQADELAGNIDNSVQSTGGSAGNAYKCYTFDSIEIDVGGKYFGTVRYYPGSNKWKIKLNGNGYETKDFYEISDLTSSGGIIDENKIQSSSKTENELTAMNNCS